MTTGKKRRERIALTAKAIARQLRIAVLGKPTGKDLLVNEPHRLSKRKWANCGNPRCLYCQNPRKRGERPIQERKADEAMCIHEFETHPEVRAAFASLHKRLDTYTTADALKAFEHIDVTASP